MRTKLLAAATAAVFAVSLTACDGGGVPAPPAGASEDPSSSSTSAAPAESPSVVPGEGATWPVEAPANGTLQCEDFDEDLQAALEEIENVVSVERASVSAEACADQDVSSMYSPATVRVKVSVPELDAPALVALNDAAYEAEVAVVAPHIPFSTFLTVTFPNGAEFNVNGGSLLLEEAFAEELVQMQTARNEIEVYAFIGDPGEPEFGQFPAASGWSIATVDGEAADTAAEMETLLNDAREELVDIGALPESDYTVHVEIPEEDDRYPEYDLSSPLFVAHVEPDVPLDPIWGEAALAWVELARDGNPNWVSFYAQDGVGELFCLGDDVSAEEQAAIDDLMEVLETLPLDSVEAVTF